MKISIIGAGRVGEATAQMLAMQKFAQEIVLIDLNSDFAKGVALDIQETASIFGFDTKLTGDSEIESIKGSDIVVITAGIPRKPGMTREGRLRY